MFVGNDFTIGQRVVPPTSFANVGTLAVFALLAGFSLIEIASFDVIVEPFLVFPFHAWRFRLFSRLSLLHLRLRPKGTIAK